MPAFTPAPAATARVCGHCDGFPVAHITTGPRRDDGTLPTLPVTCPACHGTGVVSAARLARVPVGR